MKSNNIEGVPNVVIYRRVSTGEQAVEGISLGQQLQSCKDYLDKEFGKGLYTFEDFCDEGRSGARGPNILDQQFNGGSRPSLWRLFEKIREGEVTHMVAIRMDRIYRDLYMTLALKKELKDKGIKLLLAEEKLPEGLVGELSASVIAGVAEYQRAQIGENIRMNLAHKRKQGYYLGTPGYGWRRETEEEATGRKPNIVSVPHEREIVLKLVEKYLSGMSMRQIAIWINAERIPSRRSVGKWSAESLNLVIANPSHAGLVRTGEDGGLTKGLHYDQRFYDKDTYDAVLNRRSRTRKRLKGVSHTQPFRLFAGIAFCGACGKRLSSSFHSDSPSYRCLGGINREEGSHVYISASRLNAIVLKEFEALVQTPSVIAKASGEIERTLREQDSVLTKEREALRKELERIDQGRDNLMEAVQSGSIPMDEVKERFALISAQRSSKLEELERIEAALSDDKDRRALMTRAKKALSDFRAIWDVMDDCERRECIHCVVDKVVVYADGKRKWVELSLVTHVEPVVVEVVKGIERYRIGQPEGVEALSIRELAALKHVLDGADYQDIAKYFETSPSNTHSCLTRAKEKLSAKTFLEAAQIAESYIRNVEDQLPLFGRFGYPRRNEKRLKTMEYQLLHLSAQGSSVASIARQTDIPKDRVESYLERAFQKLGVKTAKKGLNVLEDSPNLLPNSVQNRLPGRGLT